MSGADWDKILAEDSNLDFEGVDLSDISDRLGALASEEIDDLIDAIDREKAKVVRRGNVVDTALDVLKATLKAMA